METRVRSFVPWVNWGIATSFVLFQFFLQAVAGVMARQWRMEFHLTSLQVANLSASFFYSYVLLQIPVGLIYDRFKTKHVLALASLLLTMGCFLMALSSCYEYAILARILMGAGSSFGFVGMLYTVSTWFKPRYFALMVGISEALAMLGVAVSEVGIAWVVKDVGWRETMELAALASLFVFVCVLVLFSPKKNNELDEDAPSPPIMQALLFVLKQRMIWIVGFYGFSMLALVNVFATLWGIPFLRHYYVGMHLPAAASIVSMVFIGVAVGCPTISWFSHRIGKIKRVMIVCTAITLLLISIVLYIKSIPIIYMYMLIFWASFFSSAYILSFSYTKKIIPLSMRGVCLSALNMLLMLSAPILQPAVGAFLNAGISRGLSLSIIPFCLLIALCLIFFIEEQAPETE